MNAFSLLEGHDTDAEDLLARLSAAIIAKAEKRKDSNHLPSSSLDHGILFDYDLFFRLFYFL